MCMDLMTVFVKCVSNILVLANMQKKIRVASSPKFPCQRNNRGHILQSLDMTACKLMMLIT